MGKPTLASPTYNNDPTLNASNAVNGIIDMDNAGTGDMYHSSCGAAGDFWQVDLGGLYNLTDKQYWLWDDVRGYDGVGEAGVTAPANLDRLTQPGRNVSVNLVWDI